MPPSPPSVVILFVGDEFCGKCQYFKEEWKKLIVDPDLTSRFYLKKIIADGKNGIALPDGLSWIKGVPMILQVGTSNYAKMFNPVTDKMVDLKHQLTGKIFTGIPTAENVKAWALS
jgi:hypothetical protein